MQPNEQHERAIAALRGHMELLAGYQVLGHAAWCWSGYSSRAECVCGADLLRVHDATKAAEAYRSEQNARALEMAAQGVPLVHVPRPGTKTKGEGRKDRKDV